MFLIALLLVCGTSPTGVWSSTSDVPDTCILKASSHRNGDFLDILMFFASSLGLEDVEQYAAYPAPYVTIKNSVYLVAKLAPSSRYENFAPIECTMTARSSSASASVPIVSNGAVNYIPGIILESLPSTDNNGNLLQYSIEMNPAAFLKSMMSSGTVGVTCQFEMCANKTSPDGPDKCKFSMKNINSIPEKLTVHATVKLTSSSNDDRQETRVDGDTVILALDSCVDESAFIGMMSGLGVLLLFLVIMNITFAVKLCRSYSETAGTIPSNIELRPASLKLASRQVRANIALTDSPRSVGGAGPAAAIRRGEPIFSGGTNPDQERQRQQRSSEEQQFW